MLFKNQYILLNLFFSLSSTLQVYNIPKSTIENFNKEFNRFKNYSNEAKEFEKKYFGPIFYILNAPESFNNVKKLLNLLDESKKTFYYKNESWKNCENICTGHEYITNSKAELNLARQNFKNDQSIDTIEDNVFKYKYSVGDKALALTTTSVELGGVFYATNMIVPVMIVAAGPVGGLAVIAGAVLSTLFIIDSENDVLDNKKIEKCFFKYYHKSGYYTKNPCHHIDKGSLPKCEYMFNSTKNLFKIIYDMIINVNDYIDINNKITLQEIKKFVNKSKSQLNKSNSDLVDYKNKFETYKKMFDDIDFDQLDKENIKQYEEIKPFFNE